MTARQILQTKGTTVHTVGPEATLVQAADRLERHAIGALAVVREGVLVGMLSERDLARALARLGAAALSRRVGSEMTAPVITCTPETTVRDLMRRMSAHRIRHVPVVEAGQMVGLVSIGDVVRHRVREIETETAVLQDALTLHWAAAVAH